MVRPFMHPPFLQLSSCFAGSMRFTVSTMPSLSTTFPISQNRDRIIDIIEWSMLTFSLLLLMILQSISDLLYHHSEQQSLLSMAVAFSLSFPLDPENLHYQCRSNINNLFKSHQTRLFTLSAPHYKLPLSLSNKEGNFSFKSLSSSHSSSTTTTASSNLEDPFRTGRFLSNEELEKLKFLENFRYFQELKLGSLWVRVMRPEEMDITVGLLALSFAESMQLPSDCVSVLKLLIKKYLIERRTSMPHMATLIGFYRGKVEGGEEQKVQVAGSVEVCFNKRGADSSPPTPKPPKDSPYISNMAVKRSLRRRGIGWHLLKAGEKLISQMSSSREVYLHCRIIDEGPFNMYMKADYKVVTTDSFLALLMLQRRKHLMCKELPPLSNPSESELSSSDDEKTL